MWLRSVRVEATLLQGNESECTGGRDQLGDRYGLVRPVCQTCIAWSVVHGGHSAEICHQPKITAVRGGPRRLGSV